jgi:uncharacterized protein YkwD
MRSIPRTLAAIAAVVVAVVAPASSVARPTGSAVPETQLQVALLGQINGFRAAHGLRPLRISSALRSVAGAHSDQMARLGYFSHSSADGQSFSARIAQAYSPRGYRSWTVGENLVWAGPDLGAAQAFRLWLGSPPHRANLMDPRWREVGLGAVHASSAPGVYHGGPATIVTADFGARTR